MLISSAYVADASTPVWVVPSGDGMSQALVSEKRSRSLLIKLLDDMLIWATARSHVCL